MIRVGVVGVIPIERHHTRACTHFGWHRSFASVWPLSARLRGEREGPGAAAAGGGGGQCRRSPRGASPPPPHPPPPPRPAGGIFCAPSPPARLLRPPRAS